MRRLAIVFLTAACASTPATRPGGETSGPSVEALRVEVRDPTLTDFHPAVSLVLKNPTDGDVQAREISYEVLVDGQPRARSKLATEAIAPAGGEAPLVIEAEPVPIAQSAEDVQRLADKRSLDLLVRGTVSVEGAGGPWQLQFVRAGQVRTPRLPIISMNQVSVTRTSDHEIGLTFYVAVDNPNPFDVPVNALTYTITLSGRLLGEEKATAKGDKLPRGAQAIYDMPAPLDVNSAPEVFAHIKAADLDYAVAGTLDLGMVRLPVQLSGPVPIGK